MENSSGVGLVNRYALFLDDETDPLDAIKAREQAKEQKKKSKEAEKENKGKQETKPKTAPSAPRKGIKETQNIKSQDGKQTEPKPKVAARSGDRNSAAERPPPRRREDRPPPNGQIDNKDGSTRPPRRERDFGDRKPYERRNFDGEGGERRGPRPPREPRGDGPRGPRDGRGKREFERRSGSDKTGVKPVDKREGGGAHNWGNHKDDLEELNKTVSDGDQAEEKTEIVTEEQTVAPTEEEPRELTLDEYKALRNATRQKPQYNIRKAGEGEDLSQWKNMVVLEKKKEGEGEEDSDGEYEIADYPQRVGRQKRFLGIEFTFADSQRRGGGGRGRGRGRGREGARGEQRVPRGGDGDDRRRQQSAPKVDDSKDFPSLG